MRLLTCSSLQQFIAKFKRFPQNSLVFGWVGHPWIAPATVRQWPATICDANNFNWHFSADWSGRTWSRQFVTYPWAKSKLVGCLSGRSTRRRAHAIRLGTPQCVKRCERVPFQSFVSLFVSCGIRYLVRTQRNVFVIFSLHRFWGILWPIFQFLCVFFSSVGYTYHIRSIPNPLSVRMFGLCCNSDLGPYFTHVEAPVKIHV